VSTDLRNDQRLLLVGRDFAKEASRVAAVALARAVIHDETAAIPPLADKAAEAQRIWELIEDQLLESVEPDQFEAEHTNFVSCGAPGCRRARTVRYDN